MMRADWVDPSKVTVGITTHRPMHLMSDCEDCESLRARCAALQLELHRATRVRRFVRRAWRDDKLAIITSALVLAFWYAVWRWM